MGSLTTSLTLGAVTQSRIPLHPLRSLSTDLPPRDAQGPTQREGSPKTPPKWHFSSSVVAGSARAISTHPFGPVIFAKIRENNPGSDCSSEIWGPLRGGPQGQKTPPMVAQGLCPPIGEVSWFVLFLLSLALSLSLSLSSFSRSFFFSLAFL